MWCVQAIQPQNDQGGPEHPGSNWSYGEWLEAKARNGATWVTENPEYILIGAASGAVVVAPGLIATPLLNTAGFTSAGVKAGSLAAGIQSGIGNVVAGSWFATAQSAAMGGYGGPILTGIVQMAGCSMSGAYTGWAWICKDRSGKDMGEQSGQGMGEPGDKGALN
ncbi:interferon alpha-inducible IFI6/IFI27 family protein [Aspergillus saccharolyticus JOP 1030-1]|uniref:Uncharacterized protein n=1 Tax=Aspergillus saccharolyticus JOP 1030-1 TaxID=1450539 RepID=A0A318ZLH5_9EURO|nr:hypothetical protein BP01DRAFT_395398 [Aspergillus saccharolyticus JOP 1030-1]PYH41098.1 hypothetical protein BP01DRAFT_395398 [Aspergillus saccharolyticus JOP 1030-1]